MPKPKKDKLISFDGKTFWIRTEVSKPGVRNRVLIGQPTISVSPRGVRVGCIRLTREAVAAIASIMDTTPNDFTVVYQEGNYGEPSS